ncbi:hypothetical protein CRG98_036265 [Punica granatum]|uniref:MULE transposase domain-containing protein n=1 Tax=Punica granatum TaxID=22663 RepID=A0A2I0IHV1_PUNGR|nr:hypothetical protein CRG98_036265 [Punica granatum]
MDKQVHYIERLEVDTRGEADEDFFEHDVYHLEEEGIVNGSDDENAEDVERLIKFNKDATFGQMKIYRALHIAREIVEGSEKEQCAKLHDYCAELRRSNLGSTCALEVQSVNLSQPPHFEKLYICLDACKKGFLAGCKLLIGLDGCHLKGYYGGQLLTTVTQDGNRSFYVIAYAVVEQETKETWSWCLNKAIFRHREWDISGIPCKQAVACMMMNDSDPEKFVHSYYSKETLQRIYEPFVRPIIGEDHWEKQSLDPVLPPNYSRAGGRPKMKRTKGNDIPQDPSKMKKRRKECAGIVGASSSNVPKLRKRAEKVAETDDPLGSNAQMHMRKRARTTSMSIATEIQLSGPQSSLSQKKCRKKCI